MTVASLSLPPRSLSLFLLLEYGCSHDAPTKNTTPAREKNKQKQQQQHQQCTKRTKKIAPTQHHPGLRRVCAAEHGARLQREGHERAVPQGAGHQVRHRKGDLKHHLCLGEERQTNRPTEPLGRFFRRFRRFERFVRPVPVRMK